MVVFSPAERAEIERGAAEIVAQNRALRALRKSLGVTQNQLAEALETSHTSGCRF
jgi:DNA-binding transcriptional regulator YiaG